MWDIHVSNNSYIHAKCDITTNALHSLKAAIILFSNDGENWKQSTELYYKVFTDIRQYIT